MPPATFVKVQIICWAKQMNEISLIALLFVSFDMICVALWWFTVFSVRYLYMASAQSYTTRARCVSFIHFYSSEYTKTNNCSPWEYYLPETKSSEQFSFIAFCLVSMFFQFFFSLAHSLLRSFTSFRESFNRNSFWVNFSQNHKYVGIKIFYTQPFTRKGNFSFYTYEIFSFFYTNAYFMHFLCGISFWNVNRLSAIWFSTIFFYLKLLETPIFAPKTVFPVRCNNQQSKKKRESKKEVLINIEKNRKVFLGFSGQSAWFIWRRPIPQSALIFFESVLSPSIKIGTMH